MPYLTLPPVQQSLTAFLAALPATRAVLINSAAEREERQHLLTFAARASGQPGPRYRADGVHSHSPDSTEDVQLGLPKSESPMNPLSFYAFYMDFNRDILFLCLL